MKALMFAESVWILWKINKDGEEMDEQKVTIGTLAGGAVQERFEIELQKVLQNIMDPNTDWKKKRTITLSVTFDPTEERSFSTINCAVKSTLAPQKLVSSGLFIGKDGKGRALAAEVVKQTPGQIFIEPNTGEIIDLKRNAR